MATTVRTLIEQAIGTSLKNRREAIANEPVELILVLRRLLTEAFMDAAGLYPEFLGAKATTPFDALVGGWNRPVGALSVYRIEDPVGIEVAVVYDRDRLAERLHPTLVERGRVWYTGLGPGSPTAGDLTVYFARAPQVIPTGSIDVDIDPGFPDEFVPLLVYGLAIYLATKDGRADETARFETEYQSWRDLWRGHISLATMNTRIRFSPRSSVAKIAGTVGPEPT